MNAEKKLAKQQARLAKKQQRLAKRLAMTPAERKRRRQRKALNWLFYVIGSMIYAFSTSAVAAPNHIAPGGVAGISTMLNYLFSLPIGVLYFVINIPILILGWRKIGGSFIFKTICTVVMCSVFTDAFDIIGFQYVAAKEPLMASLVGGALSGFGLGLIFMRGATTGGTDVLARVLERHFRHIPIGKILLALDAIVVGASGFVYGKIDNVLYAAVYIFVSSTVLDVLVSGSDAGKMLLIATAKERETADAIMNKLDRGVTFLDAVGGYTGKERKMLMVAARRTDVFPIKQIAYQLDPNAFIITLTTDEVMGEGFKLAQTEMK